MNAKQGGLLFAAAALVFFSYIGLLGAFYPFNPAAHRIGGAGNAADAENYVCHWEHAAAAATTDEIHAGTTLTTAAQTVTTGITQPDIPRVLCAVGTADGMTGNVILTGTNAISETMSDTIALNGKTAVNGVKAFKTLTSITLPVRTHVGDQVAIGQSKTVGLNHCLDSDARVFIHWFDGATDAGSLSLDADEVEKNLYTPAGTPNGAKTLELFYLVGD